VVILGVMIKLEEIKKKEKVVLDWPAFQTVKKVQKFVKYYTNIAKLLHKLVRKDQKWV